MEAAQQKVEPVASCTRQQESPLKQGKYTMVTKISKHAVTDLVKKHAIEKAKCDEVKLVLKYMEAVQIVSDDEVDGKAHGCHMFTVNKHLANRDFDKCKSRIVLHGNEQDPHLYPDKSSLTVALHSILTCLAFASFQGITEVAKIDVKVAFIQTPMEGTPVYIRFNSDLTKLIVKMFLEYENFVNKKGCLYGKLLKALYACIQASKLWFNNLVWFLTSKGYELSPTNPCIMRQIVGDKIFLLLIYVDDILVVAMREEMERLKTAFVQKFQWITMEIGSNHSYLGMNITLHIVYSTVDMIHFIEQMLGAVKNLK